MNLGIDIQGQLMPNILTMVIQWMSTGVLLYFVSKYLFGPARNFLNQRAEYAQSQISEAEQLKSEAHQLNEQAKAEIREAGATARGLVETAKSESIQLKEKLLQEAKVEADAKLESARREIEYEKNAMRAEVSKEIVDVALAATEKLLGEKVTSDDDRKAVEKFIKDVKA